MTKNFTINKNGFIRGGKASYTADPTGALTYQVSVAVGFFITKTVAFKGSYQVDPKYLSPANLAVVGGPPVVLGDLTLTVTQATPDYSMVKMTMPVNPGDNGTARVLTGNRTIIEADTVTAVVKVSGLTLTLECVPAVSRH